MPKLNDLVPKPKTRIAFIIDRSGSMHGMERFVMDTHNEQLQEFLKNKDTQDITVTTVLFDGTVEVVLDNVPIEEAKELTNETYRLGGSTALNDALGTAIDKFKRLGDKKEDDVSYLFIIITDGYENASKEYKTEFIAEYVKELEATNKWTFTYFGEEGRGINLQQVSQAYGFNINNMTTGSLAHHRPHSLRESSTRGTQRFMRARNLGQTSVSNYYSPEGTAAEVKIDTNSRRSRRPDSPVRRSRHRTRCRS